MSNHHVLTFPPTLAAFQQAADDVRRALDDGGVSGRVRYNIELVFEEIVTNIIRHGHAGDKSEIRVSLELGDDRNVLTFDDDGLPFDPRQQPDPKPPSTIDGATVGELGLVLVRKASNRIEYERTALQRNRVTVTISAG